MAVRKRKNRPALVTCDYCGQPAQLLRSSESLYRGNDLGPVWYCAQDQAWVGCHKGTNKPLGRLADKELRRFKQEAHAAFDPFWKAKIRKERCSKKEARGAGYRWLAAQLGLAVKDCHIGMFDVAMCIRVVAVCDAVKRASAARRAAAAHAEAMGAPA